MDLYQEVNGKLQVAQFIMALYQSKAELVEVSPMKTGWYSIHYRHTSRIEFNNFEGN